MKKFLLLAVSCYLVGCISEPTESSLEMVPTTTILRVDLADASTKVGLGEKDENGKYAMYWSEDDRISVNGYISEPVVISAENPASAQFRFEKAILKYPYNILYPASNSGAVTFASLQNYVEGSFESGITPMYSCVKKGEKIALQHLSGVLKFGFTGAVTLDRMVVKSGSGYIAGDFAVNFDNGALTPLDSAVSTIEYSFGDGLQLSADSAKEFFLVMPFGSYGVCSIELYTTNDDVMLIRFNTDGDSAIKAGVFREFKPVTYKAGAKYTLVPFGVDEDELIIDDTSYTRKPTTIDGDYLVINSAPELMWLCYNGTTVDGVAYNKIRIGKDIDMGVYSILTLPSIMLGEGAEVDGNNKTITGLNMAEDASSIFGDTNNINIHDLALTDCSVNTTLQTGAGILVGMVSKGLTVNNVTFNNCSVVAPCKIGLVAGALHTGTFNISNVVANGGLVETSYVSGKSGLAGGLVGNIAKNGDGATTSTTTFTNCTVSTTVKSYMEGTNYFYGKMVGQFGGYNNNEKLYFVNCSATNAILVPLYDQGEKHAETAVLSFCEAHRADFCETVLNEATNDLLGGERYCRGEVYFDDNRFFYEWDSKRAATMITSTENDITTYYVYSAFDLAKAAGQSYNDAKKLVFKTDVDMGGHTFKPINYVRYLDGGGFELHNLKVVRTHDAANNRGAGFIIYASGTTVHKNLTFVGADVTCNHDSTIAPLEYGNDNDGGAGNAYAGVLVSRTATGANPYTASNVHVKSSKVRGVCKVGGLIGNMYNTNTGVMTVENCSVEGTTVENYDPKVWNYYKMNSSVLSNSYVVEGLQWWYTAGECGGLIGFVSAKTANITNCSVVNCNINCTGQEDKDVVANVWASSAFTDGAYKSGVSIKGNATTTIAGRHINQFIGDIRSQRSEAQQKNGSGEYTTIISDYTVSGNSYNGVLADSTNDYNHEYASGVYCPVVGCAYYTGVDVSYIFTFHTKDCAGTLTFNEKGGSATTLTEEIGNGDNLSWFGGNCKDVKMNLLGNVGTSYYPNAPTN